MKKGVKSNARCHIYAEQHTHMLEGTHKYCTAKSLETNLISSYFARKIVNRCSCVLNYFFSKMEIEHMRKKTVFEQF